MLLIMLWKFQVGIVLGFCADTRLRNPFILA